MNCNVFREKISEMLIEGIDLASDTDVMNHCHACTECADYLDEMSRTVTLIQPAQQITASPGFREKLMNKIVQMDSEAPRRPEPRRSRSRYWKIAAVAACVLGLFLITPLHRWFRVDTMAYAIEQTIKANLGIRSIHIKCEPSSVDHVSDIWAEFAEDKVARLRMSFPQAEGATKEVVWQQNEAEIWLKKKNIDLVTSAPDILAQLKMSVDGMDPRLLMESLKHKQAAGTIGLRTEEPTQEGSPITLSVTGKEHPDIEDVYQVDPQTKLILQSDRYRIADNRKEWIGRLVYQDYNKPIDPSMFKLNAPPDVVHINQTARDFGMSQGSLSDHEIAVRVAREFFEALIAEDYSKAGNLMQNLPGDMIGAWLKRKGLRFTRIVSIGQVQPYPKLGAKGFQVPCRVEVETNGKKEVQDFSVGVRPIDGAPNRWSAVDGI